jgi:type VI protein secretion system component VasF
MTDHERQLIETVRSTLNESVAHLDATTRSRLAQARARAQEPRRRTHFWLLPAGAAALASLLVAALWLGQPMPLPGDGFDAAADFELLTSSDSLELYQELDFLQWLEEEGLNAG